MFGRCCSWIRLRAISWVIGANDLPTLAAGAALPGIGENDLPVSVRAVELRTPAARGAAAVSLINLRLEKSDMIESPFPRPAQQLLCGGNLLQQLIKAPGCCRRWPRCATGPSWRGLRGPRCGSGSGTYAANRGSGRTTPRARWDATGLHLYAQDPLARLGPCGCGSRSGAPPGGCGPGGSN